MRTFLIAAAATLFSVPALAQGAPVAPTKAPAGAYVLDRPHSDITWKGFHQGMSYYPGHFTAYDIQLDFNPDDVTKSKVTATIDPKSVLTHDAQKRANGQSTFDKEVGEKFLGGAEIKFVSTSITKSGDKSGKMTGNLTFLGQTKPVTLDVTMNGGRLDARTQKYKVGFTATGSFKRGEFGMTAPGSVADEIKIEINAEFAQK